MPYARPTLTELQNLVGQDIAAALEGADALLRFSNLSITGKAQARLSHLHYGYLDWIAKQAVPFTATEEYLEGWAALKGVYRKPATSASGAVTFSGAPGVIIPAGVGVVRGDGVEYTTLSATTVSGAGTASVNVVAKVDPTGLTGAFGNAAANTVMILAQAIAGIQSSGKVATGLTGGADLETDDSLRSRMLEAYQNPPQGGSKPDYVLWAKQVPGVTRAWCKPNGFGAGTVVVYTMLDISQAAFNGFPQGTNGVSQNDEGPDGLPRGTVAAGDQLAVADHLIELQPVTALVYAVAPTASAVAFTIKGIPAGLQSLIPGAIAGVFLRDGEPGGEIALANLWSAISSVSGLNNFVIVSPSDDITVAAGALPTVGAITHTA
jgi:uncharacterized phage protein gp47/JayE